MSIRFEFNRAGFRELLTSAGAKTELERRAKAKAARANAVPSTTEPAATEPYYEVSDASTRDRARVRIHTTGARSVMHENKTHALLREL